MQVKNFVLVIKKIIDIAIKYQYESSEAFSRAFKKFHGIQPSVAKKISNNLKIYTKLHFNEEENINKKVEYKIIEKDEMFLYGNYVKTTNVNISIDAPNFFKEMEEKYGDANFGMVEYMDKSRWNVKAYWVLYSKNKTGLVKKYIPKSKWISIQINSQYAIDIQNASKMFYSEFWPVCKCEFRDLPEIEYYHDNITEFLIPIEN